MVKFTGKLGVTSVGRNAIVMTPGGCTCCASCTTTTSCTSAW